MDVKYFVESTIRKYHTRDPYELANLMHIQITKQELGKIKGYYLEKFRIKQIFLNCNLNKHDERFVLSHEIGHSVMHPKMNVPFLQKSTFLSIDRFEIEANTFAVNLLIPDEIILENYYYTVEHLSRVLGYEQSLIELRLKSYCEI